MRGLKLRYSYGKIVELSSHLLQMRGLKLHHLPFQKYHYVASFTDAWIETDYSKRIFFYIWSHLLQMRGLKLDSGNSSVISLKSHLLQMRGLKPTTSTDNPNLVGVASFTDAWIET